MARTKDGQQITVVKVLGPAKKEGNLANDDLVWASAMIDGHLIHEPITVRKFLHGGHPLAVYIGGASPLYPTIVYSNDSGELLGFDPGALGLKQA